MLSEERHAAILKRLKDKRVVTVTELVDLLDTSAATIRRDLSYLHNKGLLQKVHGGAVNIDNDYFTFENDMTTKNSLYRADKEAIAKEAASLITNDEFIYIDAGTTTEAMLPYITAKNCSFVTNGINIATYLSAHQSRVILLGGIVKPTTAAVIGEMTQSMLSHYNFTKGFFGANGISIKAGYSTPDPLEALVKETALKRCRTAFILADASKFEKISPVTFAPLEAATIITTEAPSPAYRNATIIKEV